MLFTYCYVCWFVKCNIFYFGWNVTVHNWIRWCLGVVFNVDDCPLVFVKLLQWRTTWGCKEAARSDLVSFVCRFVSVYLQIIVYKWVASFLFWSLISLCCRSFLHILFSIYVWSPMDCLRLIIGFYFSSFINFLSYLCVIDWAGYSSFLGFSIHF